MLNWNPINNEIDGLYLDNGIGIIPRHNYLTGIKNYVLATLEQLIGYLNRAEKRDDMIIFLSKSIYSCVNLGETFYYQVLEDVHKINSIDENFSEVLRSVKSRFSNNSLSEFEKPFIKEIAEMNYNEYLMKSNYNQCDYNAMNVLANLAYQILLQNIDNYIDYISVYVDTSDELISWEIHPSDKPIENPWIDWNALDNVDYFYSIYKTTCYALKEQSMEDLASADAIEKEFFSDENSKRKVSYNLLSKQYCGVIEQEINEIVQLLSPNKSHKYMMWANLKDYIKKHDITLCGGNFELYKMLDDLHSIRNLSMHGERITEEQYEIIVDYKNMQLFEIISWTKLCITEKNVSPSIDEIENML